MLRVFLAVCAVYSVIVPAFFKLEVSTASQKEAPPRENLLKGHLRPFGESGRKLQVEERTKFLDPADFFTNYVKRSKPLKLSGVVQNSRAVRLWTDDYLLALDVPQDSVVWLETRKKEDRDQKGEEMHFHEFLSIYNQTEHYMVARVPSYLRPDITVPCCLQCTQLMERGLAKSVVWFSSGGTKSVIHMDFLDNIICLIRGQKTFVMVDPARDEDKIPLLPDSTHSDIDVDSVDLTKYPLLAEVEFYHVNMTAGDCLFIPYTWLHQVRSYNSNVAINFWWNHYAPMDLKADMVCEDQCDPSLTLDKVGVSNFLHSFETTRDFLYEDVMHNPATEDSFGRLITESLPRVGGDVREELANKCFNLLDLDKDGVFTKEEYAEVPVETWKKVKELVSMAIRSEKKAEEEESSREEL